MTVIMAGRVRRFSITEYVVCFFLHQAAVSSWRLVWIHDGCHAREAKIPLVCPYVQPDEYHYHNPLTAGAAYSRVFIFY